MDTDLLEDLKLQRRQCFHANRAAFASLLEHIKSYGLPTDNAEQQDACIDSFLKSHPIRQAKRESAVKRGYSFGDYHTLKTFKKFLNDFIISHGQHRQPSRACIAYLFAKKDAAIHASFLRKCRQARKEEQGAVVLADAETSKAAESGSSYSEMSPDTLDNMVPPDRRPATAQGIAASEHHDSHDQGRDNSAFFTVASTVSSTINEVTDPDVGHPFCSSSQGQTDVRLRMPPAPQPEPRPELLPSNVDRRSVEAVVGAMQRLYTLFTICLSNSWNIQASYPASPSPYLERLYQTVFSRDWRVTIARSQEQHVAENADVLYALTGAALYQSIFQSPSAASEQRSGAMAPLNGAHNASVLPRTEHFATANELAQQLFHALHEHLKCQQLHSILVDAYTTATLQTKLADLFEKASSLKQQANRDTPRLLFKWHLPGESFSFEKMSIDVGHASPSTHDARLYKIAMCFLPSVERDNAQEEDPLYPAVVKVGPLSPPELTAAREGLTEVRA
ncbi:hypothetical protein PRZ48_012197 [Zasmidium cellare]|uniref:Uncharacterized protein n=1 Tax=Zasmidium cellare TaxID=395010 RepID=A0ABR0E460_ZASCE|nr:hypothetical protein PRZ48_012197 [Zasmidium cellare]